MTYKVKVTRAGFTSCPSCLSHIRVESELKDVECPFCGEALVIALEQPTGQSTMAVIRQSRSGLVAAALAGLVFTAPAACSDGDDVEPEYVDEPINNQDYGSANNLNNFNNFNNENNENNVADMGADMAEDMPADAGDMDADAGDMAEDAGDMSGD